MESDKTPQGTTTKTHKRSVISQQVTTSCKEQTRQHSKDKPETYMA